MSGFGGSLFTPRRFNTSGFARSRFGVASTRVPILDGYATPIGAWSTRQKLRSEYTGPIVQIRKVDPTLGNTDYDVYAQTDGKVLANGTGGIVDGTPAGTVTSFIYLTIYDQSGNGNHLVAADATKAMRAANASGVVETLFGDPCGLVVNNNEGGYVRNLSTAITSTGLSSYLVHTWGINPPAGNPSVLGLANGTGSVWNSNNGALLVGRPSALLTSFLYRNSVQSSTPANFTMFFEGDRTVSATRFDGTTGSHDAGMLASTLSSTAAFNANRIFLHAYNNGAQANFGSAGMRFAEAAIWSSDLGALPLSNIQRSAAINPNRRSKFSGKKIVWVGTSMPVTVTDNSNRNPYAMQVASQLGAWVVNVGSGSSRMTYSSTYEKTLTATVAEQTANGFSSSVNESFERRALGGSGDVDYFVIDHCINDRLDPIGAITSTTKTEYCGALNYFRTQALAAYPNVKFIVLTPMTVHAFDGGSVPSITASAAALVSWADQYDDCYLIDPMTGLGLVYADKATYFPDGTHCNMAGAALMADFIAAAMRNLNIP